MRSSAGLTLSPGDYKFQAVHRASYPAAALASTIAPMPPDPVPFYQKAVVTLKSYLSLPQNWDFADGCLLTPQAETAAIVILNAFASENIVPQFSPLNSGGLLFELRMDDVDLILDVEPIGDVHLYASKSGQEYESSGSAAHVVAALFSPFSPIGVQR